MRPTFAPFALFASTVTCLGAPTACTTKPAGELVVVVTTDLSVPADIDAFEWTVTIDGQPTPLQSRIVPLDPQHLPATLSIVSGRDTNGPVRIELAALHGGKGGVVRVRRRALLTVPTQGAKALSMPLNWLCSTDAGGPSCMDDQTCQGGACVSSTVNPQALPDYVAGNPGACFDPRNCFSSVSTVPAVPTLIGQQCAVIGTASAVSSGEENVMLVVNTSQIGNYGVCIPPNVGLCLIPLDYDAAEGWRRLTNDGGLVGIGLPPAVCRGIGTTLIGVVIAPVTDGCPAKPRGATSCTANDTCIASGGICPSDWGSAWQGYTCSGTASPGQLSSPPVACFLPADRADAGAEAGTATPGDRWCCTVGETPAKDPLLIDDMSGGPQIKITPPKNQNAGFWYTSSDDRNAQFFPTPRTLFTYSSIASSMTPDGGPMNAACFRSSGFTGLYALAGFNFVTPKGTITPGGAAFDVSAYTGVRFWAYSPSAGQSINVNFPDQNTVASDPGSSCNRNPSSGTCGDDWAIRSLILTSTWSPYVIKWSDLRQGGFGAQFPAFDKQHVFDTVFLVPSTGPNQAHPAFDFCVSQISFTQ